MFTHQWGVYRDKGDPCFLDPLTVFTAHRIALFGWCPLNNHGPQADLLEGAKCESEINVNHQLAYKHEHTSPHVFFPLLHFFFSFSWLHFCEVKDAQILWLSPQKWRTARTIQVWAVVWIAFAELRTQFSVGICGGLFRRPPGLRMPESLIENAIAVCGTYMLSAFFTSFAIIHNTEHNANAM